MGTIVIHIRAHEKPPEPVFCVSDTIMPYLRHCCAHTCPEPVLWGLAVASCIGASRRSLLRLKSEEADKTHSVDRVGRGRLEDDQPLSQARPNAHPRTVRQWRRDRPLLQALRQCCRPSSERPLRRVSTPTNTRYEDLLSPMAPRATSRPLRAPRADARRSETCCRSNVLTVAHVVLSPITKARHSVSQTWIIVEDSH